MTNNECLIEAQNRTYVSEMDNLINLLKKGINNEVLLDGEKFDEVVKNIEASIMIIKNARIEAINTICFKIGIQSFTINDEDHYVDEPRTCKDKDDKFLENLY